MHPVVQTLLVATSVTAHRASQEDIVKSVSCCLIEFWGGSEGGGGGGG